jgi:putative membrane protein
MTARKPNSAARPSLGFFDADGEKALTRAVAEVEALSCAEVVVVVRRKSGSYLHADLMAGSLGGFAALSFLLLSPWPFATVWMLLDPLLAFVLSAWAASKSQAVRRAFTPPGERRSRVETHARAAFVERGVGATSSRTGILVYVSILERAAHVVADAGVRRAVPEEEWSAAVSAIDTAAKQGRSADVAAAIAAAKGLLARALPRSADDVNELPDEVTSE